MTMERIANVVLVLVYAALLWEVMRLRRTTLVLVERLDVMNRRVLAIELDSEDRDSNGPPSLKPTRIKAPPPAGGAA